MKDYIHLNKFSKNFVAQSKNPLSRMKNILYLNQLYDEDDDKI